MCTYGNAAQRDSVSDLTGSPSPRFRGRNANLRLKWIGKWAIMVLTCAHGYMLQVFVTKKPVRFMYLFIFGWTFWKNMKWDSCLCWQLCLWSLLLSLFTYKNTYTVFLCSKSAKLHLCSSLSCTVTVAFIQLLNGLRRKMDTNQHAFNSEFNLNLSVYYISSCIDQGLN